MAKSREAAAAGRPGRQSRRAAKGAPAPQKRTEKTTGRKARPKSGASRSTHSAASPGQRSSKQADVIALLRRPEGATVAELVAATEWQPHTVRGLFSGTLKKKLGLTLTSEREERGRIYRVADKAARSASASRRRSR